ncbi:NAD(P)/FAD-dependent oxidoreductase [Mycolicibacterium holsaticum]|uniref:Pyridine nucleotide-disulfide oxidoreductase n=1 Tax=Mycolicibacterium holsaticum TaxID=152142 RepID=A0A1E3RSV2_9MYCO|nr:NAD(P)/FAD-dependent oxidoreductase [Mycolicibacterium holsaticum]ODQ92928.1 pyridine nucleotide-disulfide oxidoreductase [Mycolicibacterium holsaticum]
MSDDWECVVVGAGAAGLSAALVLGRARRRTLVIDAGEPSNSAAPMIGGLLGHDARPPAELYETGRRELAAYPSVRYRAGKVVSGAPVDDRFVLELDNGEQVVTGRVLLATGMQYCPPDLPGLDALWGVSVFQCPFCHGWEMRDKRLAALAAGEEGVHAALMLRGWSDDVVLLTDGSAELDADGRRRLSAAGVAVDERRVVELIGHDSQLTAVAFADGGRLPRDGLLVEAPLRQRSALAEQLGAACADGPLSCDTVDVDPLHRTSTPGVFAAGDLCAEQPYVAGAIAAGSQTAMIVVQSLLADEFQLPYPP